MAMSPERWRHITEVFHAALARDAAAREALLDEACAGDAALRSEVDAMLAAHASAAPWEDGLGWTDDSLLAAGAAPPAAQAFFGPYRVVGELGEGGMGVVYLAERSDGQFTRRVAIKRLGSAAPRAEVLRRFRDERQILARLDHPNIARLLDAGLDAAGVPYLVMECVEGMPVTAYCRQRSLSVRQRLDLFMKLCAAVQHAHQNLVIHRDIKPGNILVTPGGEPKLLDFGIAKILAEAQVGDATRTMTRAFTLDFASPEQLRGDPVTTASDVYSLGVVLYELLADARPYAAGGRSLPEAIRLVCETVPSPLSRLAPAERRRELVGDLDNVALKAIRREAADRYATAAELGEDIQRHLDGYPVRAHPHGRAYRAAKFLRRHWAATAATAIALSSLLASLGVAVRHARVAEAERLRAEANLRDLRRLAGTVLYELHDAIANLSGATPLRRVLVARALEYLDRLAREAPDDVGLKRELADGYQRIAQVQGGAMGANLGDTHRALESYGKALAIRRALAERAAAESADVVGLAVVELEMGALQRAQVQLDRAEGSYRSAATRLETLRSRVGLGRPERGRLALVYQRLAELKMFEGETMAALPWAERAVAEAEPLWQAAPDAAARSALAAASSQLAAALAGQRRHAEALERAQRARALLEAGLRDNPLDASQTRLLLFVLHREATELLELGDAGGAIRVREEALAVAETTLRRDPTDRWSQMGVAVAATELGKVLLEGDDVRRSARHYRLGLRIATQALAEDPDYAYARFQAADAEYGLGRALVRHRASAEVAEGCAALARVQQFWAGLRSKGELPAGEAVELDRLPRWLASCRSGPGPEPHSR